jgi:Mg2+ and Co2+ transporter CorA
VLIHGAAYQDGKKIADIALADAPDYLRRPDCFVWVALSDPEDAILDESQRLFGLHPLAVEDARLGHERPPELKWRYGYPLVMGAMATLDILLYWRFKIARWL